MQEVLMLRGARKTMNTCAKLGPHESVMIITDFLTQGVARSLAAAAYEVTPDVSIITLPPRKIDGEEPPAFVAEALTKADVFFTPVSKSITHTHAVKNALGHGARGFVMTAFVDEMLISGGIDADFEALAPRCRRMGQLWTEASHIHITTPGGTDLVLGAEGRPGNAHTGMAHDPGKMTSVTNIEASVSPVEGKAEGVIVADASIPYMGIGVLRDPVIYQVERGRIVDIKGGPQARELARKMAEVNDENVYNIAQASVGLNPHCRVCGIQCEDEGTYGTMHVGIGTSTLLGGQVKAAMHYDALMWHPTLTIDGQVVICDGEVIFDY